MDRDNITRTGAKDPWGWESYLPNSGTRKPGVDLDTEPGLPSRTKRAKGGSKLGRLKGMPGAGLTLGLSRKALSDMLTLKPYRGKRAVRNFRGGDGDVGIIRSPVRAIALLDL